MDQDINLPMHDTYTWPFVSATRPGSAGPGALPSWAAGLGVLLFLLLSAWLGMLQLSPPAVVPTDAPVTEFASGRAMHHLHVIARTPHPMGSPAHAAVRQYILQELTRLGLRPAVQTTTAVNYRRTLVNSGTVHNIVARLQGTGHGKAILLVAHYDSVPTGPGASDDGAAVAAMLETARALTASAPLRHDVIFLWTDGEEAGLLGATAFVDEHPWMQDVGLVLNFEARGTSGPSLMFETSAENGWLIREFARAAPYPVANSLSYEIYKRLPNDTDFTRFKEAGLQGLNFAYIDGYLHYHTALDSVVQIDERSLQHHGSYMLALTRHFGNVSFEHPAAENVVYFNTLGTTLMLYSQRWVVPLSLLVALVFLGVVSFGLRQGRLTCAGIVLGGIIFLASMILAAVSVTLIWQLLRTIHPAYYSLAAGDTYNSHWYHLSFVLLAMSITAVVSLWCRHTGRMHSLAVGALLWWLLAMLATSISVPGGSYLFTWPLLCSSAGLGMLFAYPEQRFLTVPRCAVLCLCTLPGLVLLTPTIYLLFVSLALRLAGVVMVLVMLLLGLLIPLCHLMPAPAHRRLCGLLILASVGCLVVASGTAGFDRHHPRPNSIVYGVSPETQQAIWASADKEPDAWTGQFLATKARPEPLPEYFPFLARTFLRGQAPVVPLAAPRVELLAEQTSADVRTLRLRLTSPRQAPVLSIAVTSPTEVRDIAINGRSVTQGAIALPSRIGTRWGLRYWALPPEGVEITLAVGSSQSCEISVVDQSYGLPAIPGTSFKPRPDSMIPTPFGFGLSDVTLVSTSYTCTRP